MNDDAPVLKQLPDGYIRVVGTIDAKRGVGQVSDGYHTFDELYEHRVALFRAVCCMLAADGRNVWRSKLHSDGSAFDGWFVMGIDDTPGCQITYHLPMARWADTDFATTLERAPTFDGHTSADVLERLAGMFK